MSFKLTILGCNSAIPTINKSPTSQLLNISDRSFLIDCAEGTQLELRRNKLKFQKVSHIFISHLHGDHYFGLIGLLTSMHLLGREKELHVFGHSFLKEIINLQLDAAKTELCYPFFFHNISHSNEVLFENNRVRVSTFALDHGIDCNGFLFEEKISPRKIISKNIDRYDIPVNKIKDIQQGSDFIDDNGNIIDNEEITIKNRKGFSYAFCSDTKYNEQIIPFIKGVHLLYHEATFMKAHKERAIRTNHSNTIDAGNIAKKAELKNLLIGHFSQRYRDDRDLLIETQSVFEKTILAKQGQTIDFSLL